MIEIVFDLSTAGSLKFAKTREQGELPGSADEVESLTLALHIGDISCMNEGINSRKELFDNIFENIPDMSDTIWKTNQKAMARLKGAEKTLEAVRVWICENNPLELCGLYFVCHLMVNYQNQLSVVCVPKEMEKDNCIINYSNTGEIAPDIFGTFIRYEETVSALRRKVYSDIWSSLVRENAPLRVLINGNLIGVPENFYDFALRANMPDGEFRLAELIGKTLIQISGIGDYWLLLRVKSMLQSGELIMVSDAAGNYPYSAVVKRNKYIL